MNNNVVGLYTADTQLLTSAQLRTRNLPLQGTHAGVFAHPLKITSTTNRKKSTTAFTALHPAAALAAAPTVYVVLPACRTDLFGLAWNGVSIVTLTYSLTPGQNSAFNSELRHDRWCEGEKRHNKLRDRQQTRCTDNIWLSYRRGLPVDAERLALKETWIYCGVARWSSVAADHCHRLTLHTRTYTTNAHG